MAYNHLNTPTKCDIKLCQMCHFIKLNWFIKTHAGVCLSSPSITVSHRSTGFTQESDSHRNRGWHTTHHLSQQHTNKPPASTTTCGVVHSAGNLGCNNAFIHQCNADVKGVDILAIHNKNHPPSHFPEAYIVYALEQVFKIHNNAYYIFKKVKSVS